MNQQRKREIINSLKMCADLSGENLDTYFEKLRKLGEKVIKNKKLKTLEKFFFILGNDTRLMILKLLSQKDYCVCELEAILDKAQSTISHHLGLLEKGGIIRGIKKGYFTHYEISDTDCKQYVILFFEQYPFIKY